MGGSVAASSRRIIGPRRRQAATVPAARAAGDGDAAALATCLAALVLAVLVAVALRLHDPPRRGGQLPAVSARGHGRAVRAMFAGPTR